jgi:hypothetical protein
VRKALKKLAPGQAPQVGTILDDQNHERALKHVPKNLGIPFIP